MAISAAQIEAAHAAFLAQARPYYGEPYDNVTFGTAAATSRQVRIPNAMLLAKTFLIVNGSATISVPATSEVNFSSQGLYALIANVKESVGLSSSPIDCSGFFLAQKLMMDYPQYADSANVQVSGTTFPYNNTTGAAVNENFTFQFVIEAPNIYSEAGLQGLVLMQNNKVAGNYTVTWAGTSAPVFEAISGTNATITALSATVQFASELYPVPTTPAGGAPDLTRYPIIQEQQYDLSTQKQVINIDPGLEIMRLTLHFFNAGVYDATDTLNLQSVKWAWNGGAVSQINTVRQVLDFLARKRYSNSLLAFIGKGTLILDFDRQAPREWFDSTGVTDLKLTLNFAGAPAANSYVNVITESMLDITKPTA